MIQRGVQMKFVKFVMFFAILAIVLNPGEAEARKRQHAPARAHRHVHAPVARSAGYADIVIDADSGEIMRETSSDDLRHPASLTKMMTLYLTFQALESGKLELNQFLPVSENASYQAPSKLGLRAGQRIRVEDAILGVITVSANDAAVVLAEGLGGTESNFARLMTAQARALGMKRTQFFNASGLPNPYQVTTARDMAILGASLINHFPDYYPLFSRETFTYAGVFHENHNRLMDRYQGMDGIKTGYIRASGFNLVASVKRGGTRIVAVIFGGRSALSRDNRMAKLLDQGFAVANADTKGQLFASVQGEGDGDENAGDNELELPSKMANLAPAASGDADLEDLSPIVPASFRSSKATAGKWGVQIGAYSDPRIGRQALKSLVSTVTVDGHPTPQVEKIKSGGVTMYRARLMSLDKNTANNICSYLTSRGKSCMTVER